jgi:hypothetical protein
MVYEDGNYYRFNAFAPNYMATAGVMNLAEEKQCYWFLGCIASYATTKSIVEGDYLRVVEVIKNKNDAGCVFKISDEINGDLVVQKIPYTDLKENLKVWCIEEDDRVIVLLPEEY